VFTTGEECSGKVAKWKSEMEEKPYNGSVGLQMEKEYSIVDPCGLLETPWC